MFIPCGILVCGFPVMSLSGFDVKVMCLMELIGKCSLLFTGKDYIELVSFLP